MPISDPRWYIKDILTNISVTIDNNITPAQIFVTYEGGPESLRHLFMINQYDCVVTLVRHRERESGPGKRIQDIPLRYDGEIPMHVTAIDKPGVTATKILNKVRREIIARVEAAAQGLFAWDSKASIWVQQDGETNQITGGFDPLWVDQYIVGIRPLYAIGTGILAPIPPIPPVVPTGYYGFELINVGLLFEDGFERVMIP